MSHPVTARAEGRALRSPETRVALQTAIGGTYAWHDPFSAERRPNWCFQAIRRRTYWGPHVPIHIELPPASITLGDDLLAWIRSIGDTDPHDYPARKRELVRKLGFGPDGLSGNVKLPYDNIQKLIDAAVGA